MEQAVVHRAISNNEIIDGLGRIGDERAKQSLERLSLSVDPNIAAYARRKACELPRENRKQQRKLTETSSIGFVPGCRLLERFLLPY